MKNILRILILMLLAACNGGGGEGGFSGLEDDPQGKPPLGEVKIRTYTPSVALNRFTGTSSTTFAVSIYDGAGDVTYKFILDGVTVLKNSDEPFLTLNGSSLSAGAHTLTVEASNTISTDSKIFQLKKNAVPSFTSSNPALIGSLLNCGQDTLTFNSVFSDPDTDETLTSSWFLDYLPVTSSTPFVSYTNNSGAAQLSYSPDCSLAGFHSVSLSITDGFETTTQTWTFAVINPAVDSITAYFPTSNNIIYKSIDTSKSFSASGSGVGALTFTWILDGNTGSPVKVESGVVTSNFVLSAAAMTTGSHSLKVIMTDSSPSNDPTPLANREWQIYKNAKPRIINPIPNVATKINLNSAQSITADIEDLGDTFTVSISKGALDCVPLSECGLSSWVAPSSSAGPMSVVFNPGLTFLGENTFTLKVKDSYDEEVTRDFTISANYFSNECNRLDPGEICTLSGLPGLGSGLSVLTDSNKIRVTPAFIIKDDLGNWFFSDHSTHTVWYYNTTSSAVSILGISVPANSIYVVAGTGIAGTSVDGTFARNMALNFGAHGGGLAWDSDRKELFVADYSNHRVWKIGTNNRANIICGGANLQTQGALAKDSRCQNPVDLAFDVTNRRLYVSQYGDHIIKYVDASAASFNSWPSYIVAGAYASSAYNDGLINLTAFPSSTTANAARLRGPWSMHLDTSDQILYFAEWQTCKLRALGLPGSTTRSFGGISITAGNLASLTRNGQATDNCASETAHSSVAFSSFRFNEPRDLTLHKSGSTILGIFLASQGNSGNVGRVNYLNNTAAPVTIGGQSVTNGSASNVFGNGTQVPTNPSNVGRNTAVVNPIGLFLDGDLLYVGVRGNNIIRSMNVNTGVLSNYLGGVGRSGYSGNAAIDSKLVIYNNPMNLLYNDRNKFLYISDSSNAMIRSINTVTGRVEDFIGTGSSSDETLENVAATQTRIRAPRGMAILPYGSNDFFLYADNGNNNCQVRGYNPYPTDELIFGTSVYANKTNAIAGLTNSCGHFVGGTARNTYDINARLSGPTGVGIDPDQDILYVSSTNSHCLLKVNAGMMEPYIGTCGTVAGSVVGGNPADTSHLLSNPTDIIMDIEPGLEKNFFFIDWSGSTSARIKYVNLTGSNVAFPGKTVYPGDAETVFVHTDGTGGYIRSIALYGKWVCYSSGTTSSGQGTNTVVCKDRTTGLSKTFGVTGAGGIQLEREQEEIAAEGSFSLTFAAPSGLAFDGEGNLYISEEGSDVIRMIKAWP